MLKNREEMAAIIVAVLLQDATMLQSISDHEHSHLATQAAAGDRAALQRLLVLHCDAISRWLTSRLPANRIHH